MMETGMGEIPTKVPSSSYEEELDLSVMMSTSETGIAVVRTGGRWSEILLRRRKEAELVTKSGVPKEPEWIVAARKQHNENLTVSSVNLSSEGSLEDDDSMESQNVQWAQGKAGEDCVHVMMSEEQGWLFVGIYDGFNGPDASEFLMGHLYRAIHNELQGLFSEVEAEESSNHPAKSGELKNDDSVKMVQGTESRRRRLWEFLVEDPEDGLDLLGSDRFAFSVDDALSVSNANAGSAVSRTWLLLSKLKHGLTKNKEGHGRKLLPWNLGAEDKEKGENQKEKQALKKKVRN